MATRRMTRGRGASPVPIIVLAVLAVGLLGSTIIFGMKVEELKRDVEKEKQVAAEEKAKLKEETRKLLSLEGFVGLSEKGCRDEFQKFKDEFGKHETERERLERLKKPLLERYNEKWPTSPPVPPRDLENYQKVMPLMQGYAESVKILEDDVGDLLLGLSQSKNKLTADTTSLRKRAEDADTQKQEADAAKKQADGVIDTLKDELKGVKEKVEEKQKDLDAVKNKAKKADEKYLTDKQMLDKEITSLKKRIEELKKPPKKKAPALVIRPGVTPSGYIDPSKDPTDGKVVTVESDGHSVMISIGRRDWVREGMEFRVYDETNPEDPKEKGRIQVRRVYDTISHAKVITQNRLDPILRGMAIKNAAFAPGKKLVFVLEGKFVEPNLKRYLSRYPCKINEKVDSDTDYLIVGSEDREAGDVDPRDTPNFKEAQRLEVTIIKEVDMLRYLGERE